jgi:DNA-binding LacI/PurR family transcriptional regulator/signal transduction histidine kinase
MLPARRHMTRTGSKTKKARRARSQDSRLTIGLLIGRLGDQRYQAHVWPGVADVAEEQDVNLVCFVGGALRAVHEFDLQRNVAYDLASPENVDGLVAMSGSLGQFIGPEQLRYFYERYHPMAMTSIAMALDGIPSVLVDNQNGMRKAVTHLIEVHGLRRIAFIRGPEGSPEAEQRYQTYTEVLAQHGLPLDPALVASGNFLSPSGEEAIRLLLDERKADLEAVVSANDEMALGALAALRERGIRVPDGVSVVGFDDIEEARFAAPPLTTIRQPLYEQGRRAAEMLLALLAGEDVPERVMLPTELVVRRSCGCLSQPASPERTTLPTWPGETLETTFAGQRERTLSEMVQVAGEAAASLPPDWAERLLDAFFATLEDRPRGAFLLTLEEILRQVGAQGGDVIQFHQVLSVLHHHAPPSLAGGEDVSDADSVWQQARASIGQVAHWAQVHRRIQTERRAFEFTTRISEPLMTAFDVTELTDVVACQLPRMGITSCYLSLYEYPAEEVREAPTKLSRLILAYDQNGRIELEPGGRCFPSRQLVPDDILSRDKRYAIMLEPLHFRDETQLGFVLFEPLSTEAGALREALSRQISTALKGALLLQERKRAEETLKEYSERLEEMVEERTRKLQEAQEQLVRQERLAVLGQLAGGVGHELRNPLGVISNAVYFLQTTLSEADETTREYLGILSSEVRSAERIISDLLDLSRTRPSEREESTVSELVAGTLERQPPPENVRVTTEVGSDLPLAFVDPRQIGQVLDNLVLNACQAMPKGGDLTIGAQAGTEEVTLSVTDTGCGISKENMGRLFEPLFTTKVRGIGLGLVISRNLVEANGGSIEVTSEVKKGSTFTVTLPIKGKVAS